MTNGIFEVTATDNPVTPNICEKATVTVTGYNIPNAVDSAHTIVSRWGKATGIPVVCDGYTIIKSESSKTDDTCTLTIEFYVI